MIVSVMIPCYHNCVLEQCTEESRYKPYNIIGILLTTYIFSPRSLLLLILYISNKASMAIKYKNQLLKFSIKGDLLYQKPQKTLRQAI